jgi:hypothetical protein
MSALLQKAEIKPYLTASYQAIYETDVANQTRTVVRVGGTTDDRGA